MLTSIYEGRGSMPAPVQMGLRSDKMEDEITVRKKAKKGLRKVEGKNDNVRLNRLLNRYLRDNHIL